MPGVKWNISLILLLLCMAATQKQMQSQPQNQPQDQPEESADSAAYEAWLGGINRRKPVVANARLAMAETVKRGAWDEAQLLLAFMDNRQKNGPWLNGPERLLLLTILTDTATLLNPAALDPMLAETWGVAGSIRPDGVRDRLRYLLRSGAASASDRFDGYRPTEEERRFFNLLLNHLTAHLLSRHGHIGRKRRYPWCIISTLNKPEKISTIAPKAYPLSEPCSLSPPN